MSPAHSRLVTLVPFIFVLLWSTGFIGAKFALPYIEPFNLLFIRMLLNLLVFAVLISVWKARWLTPKQIGHQMIVGLLVHAGYLGGVFAAIKLQMPAGLASLLVGLQPLLTAVLVLFGGNTNLRRSQWSGLLLGIAGITLVLYGNGKLGLLDFSFWPFFAALIALVSITTGTLYQKRFGGGADLLTASFFQYVASAIVMGVITWQFETGTVNWQLPLFLSLSWLVLGLSVSAVLLLLFMIREGEASRVSAYFYLVPPATAFEAWLLFGESFSLTALFGVGITVLGVYLVLQR
jgi:drug/metabolite transporter (DMT)-like permease